MATLYPFRALRPTSADAAKIAAVPYDVVSTDEARALANGNPLSFLRVSRAELELPDGADPYSAAVYERAAKNFESLRKSALIVAPRAPVARAPKCARSICAAPRSATAPTRRRCWPWRFRTTRCRSFRTTAP